jgi:protein-S-isoprenylcysteine O-methyltransferase Ste14
MVTSGPYRFVRHPSVMAAYFVYSAIVEERLMSSSFPTAYRSYRARTKMLVPFVL